MPKNIPALKPKEIIRILESGGCAYLREGKGDHTLYYRYHEGKKRVVPMWRPDPESLCMTAL